MTSATGCIKKAKRIVVVHFSLIAMFHVSCFMLKARKIFRSVIRHGKSWRETWRHTAIRGAHIYRSIFSASAYRSDQIPSQVCSFQTPCTLKATYQSIWDTHTTSYGPGDHSTYPSLATAPQLEKPSFASLQAFNIVYPFVLHQQSPQDSFSCSSSHTVLSS